jgi:hypothetical protein
LPTSKWPPAPLPRPLGPPCSTPTRDCLCDCSLLAWLLHSSCGQACVRFPLAGSYRRLSPSSPPPPIRTCMHVHSQLVHRDPCLPHWPYHPPVRSPARTSRRRVVSVRYCMPASQLSALCIEHHPDTPCFLTNAPRGWALGERSIRNCRMPPCPFSLPGGRVSDRC